MVDPKSRPVAKLLRMQQSAEPDAIVETLSDAVADLGGREVVLYLIDYEQLALMPHPDVLPGGEQIQVATVDGSMAGRAFTSATPLASEREEGWRIWIPVTEQANRLGVLALALDDWNEEIEDLCAELGLAAAQLVLASARYSDLPHLLRRRKDMDLAAEMQWSLLPPLSFSAAGVTIAGQLEPAYEVGGDCFDFAFNDGILHFAVLDTVGHGLSSAVLASLLIGAYRHGRRADDDLGALAENMDAAARTFPAQPAFATGILGRFDAAAGCLRWLTCGHPQPIIVRGGATLPNTAARVGVPIGLGAVAPVVGELSEVSLEPGDGVLIYTDGVVEARAGDGEYFGEERLRDLLAREHAVGGSPQEVTRRLVRSTVEHAGSRLRDDSTMLYIRWDPSGTAS